MKEIKERMDWLEEMEKLGEGRSYQTLIKSEIEERLRRIKQLQPDSNELDSNEPDPDADKEL